MDIPHAFADPALLERALTHASAPLAEGQGHNERLEFLGDAVLDLIVAAELYAREPELPEGAMTQLKSGVVSRKSLAHAADGLGLAERATIGGGMRGRVLPASVRANLFEALVGAVYIDAGFEAARAFALDHLGEELEATRAADDVENPKQRLQQLSQARWGHLPEYEVVEVRGRAHARAFLVTARIGDQGFPSAWGRTRKEAESWAAYEAMLVLDAAGD